MTYKLKKIIFSFYLWYLYKSPVKNGNAFLGRIISKFAPISYTINGIKLFLNPSSYIDQNLIYYHKHDEEVNKWINNFLTSEDIFLDIGANIGYFSLYAAKIAGCNVLAFEPSKREYYRFYKNIIANQLNNIVLFPYGLGNEDTKGSLNLANFQKPGQNSLLTNLHFSSIEQETVLIKKLKNVITKLQLQKIRLIKIDVEGYENQVLVGMQDCMEYLKEAKFIVEITTIKSLIHQLKDAKLIYQFFNENGFKPLIGFNENKQYNELFSYEN